MDGLPADWQDRPFVSYVFEAEPPSRKEVQLSEAQQKAGYVVFSALRLG